MNRKQLRVVIADDSTVVRDSLSSLVSRLGDVQIVGLARTGAEALELIQSQKPDLVTLDIRMPEMNGIRVLEAIRRERLAIRVIIITAVEQTDYRRRCLDLGANFYFDKATEFEKVIDVLRDCAANLNQPATASTDELSSVA